jgi:hypothetical protein
MNKLMSGTSMVKFKKTLSGDDARQGWGTVGVNDSTGLLVGCKVGGLNCTENYSNVSLLVIIYYNQLIFSV